MNLRLTRIAVCIAFLTAVAAGVNFVRRERTGESSRLVLVE